MFFPSVAVAALTLAAATSPEPLKLRGYGWLLEGQGSTFQLYQSIGGACWLEKNAAEVEPAFARRQRRRGRQLALSEKGDDRSTIYLADRIKALPAGCDAPDRSDAAAVRTIAALMQAHYPGAAVRQVDFAAKMASTLSALPADASPERAFAAAERLLTGLNDPHLELEATINDRTRRLAVSEGPTLDAVRAAGGEHPERSWLTAWRAGVEHVILQDRGHTAAANRIFWGVRDNVGYLAIVTMGGFDPQDGEATAPLDKALDEAMTDFEGVKAVVVDVSNNRGGYDAVSRRIAERFTDRPRLAYAKRPWSIHAGWTQQVQTLPSARRRYLGPVWLLTSDITVSAGETFAQLMRVLPNIVHAGTPTRGAFSDQYTFTLPNGWRFAMPMEQYLDQEGRSLEGHGLVPTQPLALYNGADPSAHSLAVAALIGRLSKP
ncbi:S41 family peptidase [soil metagenome]